MKTLSSKEIVGMLREFGVHEKKDLFLYLVLYKSYFSLHYCRSLRRLKRLKKLVYTCARKFDRYDICYVTSTEI